MADRIVGNQISADPTHTHAHAHAHAGTDIDALPIPPLDPTFFAQDINFSFDEDFDFTICDDIEDLDFTLDDLYFPSDTEDYPNFNSSPDSCFINQAVSEPETCQATGDLSSGGDRVLDFIQSESGQISGFECQDAARALNFPSLESGNLNQDGSGFSSSQGSGNKCCTNESVSLNYNSLDSGDFAPSHPSPDSVNSVDVVANKEMSVEELGKTCLFKRKKEDGDVTSEPRKRKHGRSSADQSYESNPKNNEEEKKKSRLIRNRESAQISRQRKKHYVGELEDKLRKMHSAVSDLNSKILYIMAENASLKQQLSAVGTYPHPPMAPMAYPWVPYMPYFVNPQGSQVPLLPIPKLKPQQPVLAPKAKKVQSKKTEGKTKKVASISFLGLLFFILLFGGLVPRVNIKYRDYMENKHYDLHHGTAGPVKAHLNGTRDNLVIGFSSERLGHGKEFTNSYCERGQVRGPESNIEFSGSGNTSEPLFASLYVRRNDTMVKIDGNLIIHSAMATEKAMAASREDQEIAKSGKETSLVLAPNMGPAISIQGVGRNGRHGQKALGLGSGNNLKSTAAEGELQKWFHEGLTGPMLSSGMCTEVFQFDVLPSSPGSIIPATSAKNISTRNPKNNSNKGRNRRILIDNLPPLPLPLPLPRSTRNFTKERIAAKEENSHRKNNNSLSSMVVSVLVDPREISNSEEGFDGIKGTKSLSRVFVVLLLDGVKYVTYSCKVPLMGSTTTTTTTHLVAA